MAIPKNLTIDLPDFCSSCTKGDFEFESSDLFLSGEKTTFYKVNCIYHSICTLWASKGDET